MIRSRILCLLALGALAGMPWAIFVWSPPESRMNDYFRIFFIHIPFAWWGLFSLFTVFASSIGFLCRRSPCFDNWAQAAVETGVLFSTITLATGMVWAKLAWGVWWRWEPKLFTTFLLCLMYLGCILLRNSGKNRASSQKMCAVLAIAAFANVPFIFFSSRWLQGAHPHALVLKGNFSAEMLPSLLFCIIGAGIVWLALTMLRFHQITALDRLNKIHSISSREGKND